MDLLREVMLAYQYLQVRVRYSRSTTPTPAHPIPTPPYKTERQQDPPPKKNGSNNVGFSPISQITEFCDNDTTDESNLHVAGAPNKHNRICDLKSSWEVMREHPDFASKLA